MIRFLQPEWFWLLAALPVVLLWRGRRGPIAAVEYSDVGLAREVARRSRSRIAGWLWLLPIVAGILMIAGLARPQRAHSRTEVTANGIDIVLGLDVSGSMQALDFEIDGQRLNRIAVVKSVVAKFIEERPNDRIGLIAFAGSPYLVSPVTLDHDWLQQNLERVNIGVGDDGTAIGSAIAASVNRLRTTPAKSKVVILLTDGMNNTGKISPLSAAEAAKALGVRIYTIGVGVRGKAPVPVKDEAGNMHIVMAKVDVDEKTLQQVADDTGGKFYRATDTNSLQEGLRADQPTGADRADCAEIRTLRGIVSLGTHPVPGHPCTGHAVTADAIPETTVTFTHPGWLAGGAVACTMLILLWWRYDARQYTALARFVSANLRHQLTRSISVGKRRLQRTLYLIALALLFVALAGPLVGYRWELVNRRGNEIVFAIDTSRSMSTPDVKPDRLTRAKLAIDDFVQKLDGDAVGIVAFAGSAFLVCPITLDYAAFHESLSAIDTNTIPLGGTNISSAINEAQAALRRRPGSDKILILVTDGEDLEGSALSSAQAATRDDGLKIYTVGVGSSAGELIPLPRDQGGGFVKDESGAFVKSRLDEAALQAIAAATGGAYVPLGVQGEGLESIYKTVLGPLAKHDLASRQQKIYTERFQWPLAGSLAALLLSLLIGTRRRVAKKLPTRGVTATLGGLLLLMLASHPARADSTATPAPLLEFNAGTAAYRAGQFPQAAQAFQQSINHAPSGDARRLADQQDAYYNLGNTLYRTGQKTAQSAPQETIQKWTDAVKAYDTALQLRADDADSKFNRDLVKRKLDALKNQPKPPPDQNKDKDKNQGQGQGQGQPPPQGKQPPAPGQQPSPNQPPSANQQPPGQGSPLKPRRAAMPRATRIRKPRISAPRMPIAKRISNASPVR